MQTCRCQYECKNIDATESQSIFTRFWSCRNWQAQSNYTISTVTVYTKSCPRYNNTCPRCHLEMTPCCILFCRKMRFCRNQIFFLFYIHFALSFSEKKLFPSLLLTISCFAHYSTLHQNNSVRVLFYTAGYMRNME